MSSPYETQNVDYDACCPCCWLLLSKLLMAMLGDKWKPGHGGGAVLGGACKYRNSADGRGGTFAFGSLSACSQPFLSVWGPSKPLTHDPAKSLNI